MTQSPVKGGRRVPLGPILTQLVVFAAVVVCGGIAVYVLLFYEGSASSSSGAFEAGLMRQTALQTLLTQANPLVGGNSQVLVFRWIPHSSGSNPGLEPEAGDAGRDGSGVVPGAGMNPGGAVDPWYLWIQLPSEVENYAVLDLGDLARDQLIHYGPSWSRRRLPRVTGQLSWLRQEPDAVVLWVQAQLEGADHPTWMMDRPIMVPLLDSTQSEALSLAHGPVPQATDRDTRAAKHQAAVAQRLIGRWKGHIRGAGGRAHFDIYFQFEDDGRCTHATVRGSQRPTGYAPGMKYGHYDVVDDYLIMTVEKFVFDEPTDNNHMILLQEAPALTLKITWEGQRLILTGDYRLSNRFKFTAIEFERASFPDLRQYRPARDRNPGFQERPEPTRLYPYPGR